MRWALGSDWNMGSSQDGMGIPKSKRRLFVDFPPLYPRATHEVEKERVWIFITMLATVFPLGWTNSLPGHLSGDQTRKPDGDSFFRCSFLFHGMPRDVDVATRWNVPHSSLSTLIETLEWWFDCLPIIPRCQTWSGNVCSGDKIVFVWAGDNIPNIYPSPVSRFPGRLEILSSAVFHFFVPVFGGFGIRFRNPDWSGISRHRTLVILAPRAL